MMQASDCLPASAAAVNAACACSFLDAARLRQQLESEPALTGLAGEIAATRPHLFSASTVFITPQQAEAMADIVAAVEAVVSKPAWIAAALAQSPALAAWDFGPRGAFLGLDFHLDEAGPQLIEINTNAGGFLLNLALAQAQIACCDAVAAQQSPATDLSQQAAAVLAMFEAEWALQGRSGRPQVIAIVDDDPEAQYLYPEFRLFQTLFTQAGYTALILDPQQLVWRDGRLWAGDLPVDLIYNRLTDFYLAEPQHAALATAYAANAVVLTPNPHAHALYANKRHLARLSDAAALQDLGVPEPVRDVLLAGVPRTEVVSNENAAALWARRRHLFFKPASGFGSRAAYRGDKLTRRVWAEILAGDYVAQALVAPGARRVPAEAETLKFDVRAYAYRGQIQLFAARLYQGQTTNFRTLGGGFAPVFLWRSAST